MSPEILAKELSPSDQILAQTLLLTIYSVTDSG